MIWVTYVISVLFFCLCCVGAFFRLRRMWREFRGRVDRVFPRRSSSASHPRGRRAWRTALSRSNGAESVEITDPRAVPLSNSSIVEKRGWTRSGTRFEGWYRTKWGAWEGIVERRGDIFVPSINLDRGESKIRRHAHWPCFSPGKREWYSIHLKKQPRDGDVGSIIHYVERLICESHEF